MHDPIICDVYNGDARVGTLTRIADDSRLTIFEYSPDYTGPALNLSMPKDKGPLRSIGLHPYFSNLISEGWLEEAQQRVLKARQSGYNIATPSRFDILAYFGRDCIGAVRIEPRQNLAVETIQGLKDMASKLAQRNNALVPGVQPKILARKNDEGEYSISNRKHRSTHIAKLPHVNPDLKDILCNEFVTTEVFNALLPEDKTSEVEIDSIAGCITSEVLLIKRFDRAEDGTPLEFYEFNQLLNKDAEAKYDGAYKEIADFIRSHADVKSEDGIKTNLCDIDVLFKRLLGTILVENGDAHMKNFALLRQDNEFRLSPNYDIVSCARYRRYSSMALSIGPVKSIFIPDLKPKHIVMLAKDFGIMSKDPTVEEIQKVSDAINSIGKQVKGICSLVKGENSTNEFPRLSKILAMPYYNQELINLAKCIHKRWNGTLSKVDFFMQKELAKRHGSTADLPASLSSYNMKIVRSTMG